MKLIFIYGPPAAGKLTVARELSKVTGFTLIDNHKVKDYLTELLPYSNPDYGEIRSQLLRSIFVDIFKAMTKANVNHITTFAPISPGTPFIRQVKQVIEEGHGEALFVQLLPSHDVLLERVISESRKGKKIDTVDKWQELVGGNPASFKTHEDFEHCVIDNSNLTVPETVQQIIMHYNLNNQGEASSSL